MLLKPEGLALQLLTDPAIYEARAGIQKAVLELLGNCAEKLQKMTQSMNWLPAEALASSPKITRGDNYLGKPWMVLDYPRVFEKEAVFAFRTMVLFGDAIHCTFHISGRFLQQYDFIAGKLSSGGHHSLLLCNEGSPWIHHVNSGVFKPTALAFQQPHALHGFIKFGKEISFADWETVPEKVTGFYQEISLLLQR